MGRMSSRTIHGADHDRPPSPAPRPTGRPRRVPTRFKAVHRQRLGRPARTLLRLRASRPRSPPRAAPASPSSTRASGSSCRPGGLKVRSNDTDYPFRAHSAFAHLTGWGSDARARQRARARADRRRPRGDAVLPRARRPRLRRVLREPRDRRVLDRPAPVARAGRGRPRPRRRAASPSSTRCSTPVDADTLVVREADRDLTDRVDGRAASPPTTRGVDADDDADDELARDLQRAAPGQGRVRGRRDARSPSPRRSTGFDDVIARPARASSRTRAASAWSRASSTAAPAPTATRSATTRSPQPGRTPASCTGPATTARSCPAT